MIRYLRYLVILYRSPAGLALLLFPSGYGYSCWYSNPARLPHEGHCTSRVGFMSQLRPVFQQTLLMSNQTGCEHPITLRHRCLRCWRRKVRSSRLASNKYLPMASQSIYPPKAIVGGPPISGTCMPTWQEMIECID